MFVLVFVTLSLQTSEIIDPSYHPISCFTKCYCITVFHAMEVGAQKRFGLSHRFILPYDVKIIATRSIELLSTY